MIAVALSRGGNTRGGSNGTQEHLHPPVLQGVVGVDGLLCIVGVVLILQVELQAAQSVDLLNGDLRAALGRVAVNGCAAGQGAGAADFDGALSSGTAGSVAGFRRSRRTAAAAAGHHAERHGQGKTHTDHFFHCSFLLDG